MSSFWSDVMFVLHWISDKIRNGLQIENKIERVPETQEVPEEDHLDGDEIIKAATRYLNYFQMANRSTQVIHKLCIHPVRRTLPTVEQVENICRLVGNNKKALQLILPLNFFTWAGNISGGARFCFKAGLSERQALAAALFGLAQLYGADQGIFESICRDYEELELHDIVKFWDRIDFASKTPVGGPEVPYFPHGIWGKINLDRWGDDGKVSLMALVDVVSYIEAATRMMNEATKPVDAVERDEERCNVCLEEFGSEQPVVTRCGHVFGRQCIEDWLTGGLNRGCPYCRGDALTVEEKVVVRNLEAARYHFEHNVIFQEWRVQIYKYDKANS